VAEVQTDYVPAMSTAFITGCASGFGFHLTQRLLAEGWIVVGGDLEIDGLAARIAPGEDRLLVLPLDVRQEASVRLAAQRTLSSAGPIDVLVNNAGYAVFGTQEEADLEAIRDLFDVNVLGAARVTRAFLPALRARRGTVVQISSVAGRTVFPESGFYAATKHAIEAMSEALYQEVCTFGVRVRVIQPGSFATGFLARAQAASLPRSPASPYASLHPRWDARKLGVLEAPQDPALVVDAIVASLAHPAGFLRVPVGSDGRRILALRDALSPDAWVRLAAERTPLMVRGRCWARGRSRSTAKAHHATWRPRWPPTATGTSSIGPPTRRVRPRSRSSLGSRATAATDPP
jgi:NAD(P)-dependent dehydrogenase (short-subunit alcohol dehydrogenase family)